MFMFASILCTKINAYLQHQGVRHAVRFDDRQGELEGFGQACG